MVNIARPRKHRNVCGLPGTNRFGPLGVKKDGSEFVTITIDQYETIRLIDLEGLNQQECSEQMDIARTTVQRIYSEARKKIAEALVGGKVLRIEGGDYKLCSGRGRFCARGNCNRSRRHEGRNMINIEEIKGEKKLMKIAIPVNEKSMKAKVSENFGRAEYFLIYDLDSKGNDFIDNKAASTPGGAGIIAAQTVVDSGVDVLITPRCGKNAADVLLAGGVKIYKSEDISVEENIEKLKEKELHLLEEIHSGFHKHEEK